MNELTKAKLIADLCPMFQKVLSKYTEDEDIDGLIPPNLDEHLALICVQAISLMSAAAIYERDNCG